MPFNCKPWSDETIVLAKQMREAGASYTEIGAAIGKTKNAVQAWFRSRRGDRVVKVLPWPKEHESLAREMRNAGHSHREIAAVVGRTKAAVCHFFKRERDPHYHAKRVAKWAALKAAGLTSRAKNANERQIAVLVAERDQRSEELAQMTPAQILMGDPPPSRSSVGASLRHPQTPTVLRGAPPPS